MSLSETTYARTYTEEAQREIKRRMDHFATFTDTQLLLAAASLQLEDVRRGVQHLTLEQEALRLLINRRLP